MLGLQRLGLKEVHEESTQELLRKNAKLKLLLKSLVEKVMSYQHALNQANSSNPVIREISSRS